MTPREAAKVIGVSHVSVINWVKQGKLQAKQISTSKTGLPRYDIPDSEVARIRQEKMKEGRLTEQQKNRSLEITPVIETPDRNIKKGKGLTRAEAERVIKQEEAIRRQRENMLADRKVIPGDEISAVLRLHYRALLNAFEECVDTWGFDFNLSSANQNKMLDDWKRNVVRHWGKVKRELQQD